MNITNCFIHHSNRIMIYISFRCKLNNFKSAIKKKRIFLCYWFIQNMTWRISIWSYFAPFKIYGTRCFWKILLSLNEWSWDCACILFTISLWLHDAHTANAMKILKKKYMTKNRQIFAEAQNFYWFYSEQLKFRTYIFFIFSKITLFFVESNTFSLCPKSKLYTNPLRGNRS